MVTKQLDMFTDPADQIVLGEPERVAQRDGMKTLKTIHKAIQIPVRRRRREAITALLPLLKEWVGTTIYIDSYDVGGRHYWVHQLRLDLIGVEFFPWGFRPDKSDLEKELPSVIALHGKKGGHVRIFTDYLEKVRVNDYGHYKHYLLDFRAGVGQWSLDRYHAIYSCLTICKFDKKG